MDATSRLLYINQLHLFTVMTLTGKVQLVEKDGDKQVVVQESKPSKTPKAAPTRSARRSRQQITGLCRLRLRRRQPRRLRRRPHSGKPASKK